MPHTPVQSAGFDPVPVASLDREKRRSILAAASGVMLVVVPIMGAATIAVGFRDIGLTILGSQVLNLICWLLLRKKQWVDFCGWVMLSITFATVAATVIGTGALVSGALPWLLLVPLVAGYVFGLRGSLIFGGVVCAFLAGLMIWERGQLLEGFPLARGPAGLLSGLSTLGSTLLLAVVTSSLFVSLRRAELTRRESERGFRDSLEQLPDGFLVLEPASGKRTGFDEVYRNQAAAAMLAPLEAENADLFDLQTRKKGPRLRLDLARLAMDGHSVEVHGLGHPRLERVFDLTATRWGRRILVCLHDATRRESMQRELHQARKVAEQASLAKSEFLAGMSHEIRTPMNGVLGMARLAQESAQDAETEEYLATIHSCAESLLHLLNDILDLSKIEAGRLELERTRFDLQEVLDGLLDALAPRALEQGIDWNAFRRPEVPRWIFGDPTRLRQILLNLAGNAIKFTLEGEVRVELTGVEQEEDRTRIRFEVRDTGIGIRPDRLESLFDRYTQAEDSTTRNFGGTGLGLAISHQLVAKMGGLLRVESVVDEGSVFYFELSFDHASPPPGAFGAREDLAGRRVLVIDANATTAEVLCLHLRELGCRYDSAASAEEAVEKQRQAMADDDPYEAVIGQAAELQHPELSALRQAECRRARWIHSRSLGVKEPSALREFCSGTVRRPARPKQLRKVLLEAFGLPPDEAGRAPDAADGTTETKLRGRVLLAEDNPVNQKLVLRMLERHGVDADCVADGEAALQAAESGEFALILMDCEMPILDGFEATRRIRALDGQVGRVPVVAMTAHAMSGDKERCLQAGMDDYLSKPVDFDAFDEVLRRFLGVAAPSPSGS